MGIIRNLVQSLVAASVVAAGISMPALADPTADELLQSLRTAGPQEAQRIDRQITAVWSRSGSPSMDLLLRRGREALEKDDVSGAIEHFTALTDHAPDFAEGWHGLARAYFEAELYGPTLDALGHVLALNPDHFSALFGLGVMFQQFGDTVRAEEAFREVLRLYPHHEQANRALESLKSEGIGHSL
jgi:tetratricopeptide (TPR) repeat protein